MAGGSRFLLRALPNQAEGLARGRATLHRRLCATQKRQQVVRRPASCLPIFWRATTTSKRRPLHIKRRSSTCALTKREILLALFFVTVLLVFATTWVALFLAKQVTEPIQALAEATREIARGNFDHQIDVRAQGRTGHAGALVQSR